MDSEEMNLTKPMIARYCLVLCCIAAALFCPQSMNSQTNENVAAFETWMDLTLKYYLSDKTWVGGDFGGRGVVSDRDWNAIYFRPTISHRLTREFAVSGAIGSFNTFQKSLTNTYELRFSQDALLSWPDFGWIKLYQRLRMEERFFYYDDSTPSGLTFRARYALGARSKNVKIIGPQNSFFFGVAWEIFLPIGSRAIELFSNNQRFSGLIGYDLNDYLELQLLYQLQRSRVFAMQDADVTEHIFRIRLLYIIKPPKG